MPARTTTIATLGRPLGVAERPNGPGSGLPHASEPFDPSRIRSGWAGQESFVVAVVMMVSMSAWVSCGSVGLAFSSPTLIIMRTGPSRMMAVCR